MKTPNVNFFIHSVPYIDGINHTLYKDKWKERKFYSCTDTSYNYIGYVNNGSENKIDFVEYSGNSEKSSGLFDKDGLCDKNRIIQLKKGFSQTKSPIWHGLISFEEIFGKRYCDSFVKAYELMTTQFTRFLSNAGFDVNNIEWCAGLHTNTDNRHIHFTFYEKEPLHFRRTKKEKCFSHGMVGLPAIQKVKVECENYLTGTTSKLARQRKELSQNFKDALARSLTKGEFNKKMKQVISLIPKTGRISYDSENMIFMKNKIDYLVDLIIKQDEKTYAVYHTFMSMLLDKDESVKRMCEASKMPTAKVLLYDKYEKDMYRRLGNIVIKELLEARTQMKNLEFKTTNRLIKKRINKSKTAYLLDESLRLSEKVQKEAIYYFQQHMKILEEMKIKVLIEQGVIEL